MTRFSSDVIGTVPCGAPGFATEVAMGECLLVDEMGCRRAADSQVPNINKRSDRFLTASQQQLTKSGQTLALGCAS
jgi:hypothetical protein